MNHGKIFLFFFVVVAFLKIVIVSGAYGNSYRLLNCSRRATFHPDEGFSYVSCQLDSMSRSAVLSATQQIRQALLALEKIFQSYILFTYSTDSKFTSLQIV